MILRYAVAMDPGGASGTPCDFVARTNVSGSASYAQETDNLVGAATATVVVQVTSFTTGGNTAGALFVNGTQVFLNSSFTVTLDGSGNGSFVSKVSGDPSQTGTTVFSIFSIQSVSVGQLASPTTQQVSKSF